jgi:hypothetical protein
LTARQLSHQPVACSVKHVQVFVAEIDVDLIAFSHY